MIAALIAFFLPSFLGVPFRKIFGATIGHGTRIGIFSFVDAKEVVLGERVKIKSFALIRTRSLKMKDDSFIKGPSIIKANTIIIGEYSSVSPLAVINAPLMNGADFSMGRHSQIFPFCWLEPGEGIEIGNQVGVGGHTLIFTHGSWTNYLNGGPVSFGKVTIRDGVWLPWRVFILPNVTIGENVIVAAHSTVSKSVPDRALIGGAPAKVIKEDFVTVPSSDVRLKRVNEILTAFPLFQARKGKDQDQGDWKLTENPLGLTGHGAVISLDSLEYKNPSSSLIVEEFVEFIRRYGIRLSRIR
jgi:acetyltransferase-like isoleucine patch superfamily enzyme